MLAARLHGVRDLRLDEIPPPAPPARGEVLVRVSAVGICGSDLHAYQDGRIGEAQVETPLTLGHEFAGLVEECGGDALDGNGVLLHAGMRVAVDPATPCLSCEMCARGHPNLCTSLHFCGLYPDEGCLRERVVVSSRNCFPLPDSIDDATGALLEPLGVAMHAVRLAKLGKGTSIAILGAGPIGLLILKVAKLAGADPLFVTEPLPWRLALAERFGGVPIRAERMGPVKALLGATGGRGVDVAIEAAWADETVQQAAEVTVPGGRVVLVGIPSDDRLFLKHSTARRKGLTLLLSRRMKHTYPEAIRRVEAGEIDLTGLVTHTFPLAQAPEAFALNEAYADGVVKVIVAVHS
jgi:L-iditol 2-dehydrogenase